MEKKVLAFIQAIIGYEWLASGIEKLRLGQNAFSTDLEKTLNFFASKNPNGLYKNFLLEKILPSSQQFALLIPWSEFLAGLVLLINGVFLIFNYKNRILNYLNITALVGLVFLNINFWFAAGWTGPATAGFNLVLGLIELSLLFYFLWTEFSLRKNN